MAVVIWWVADLLHVKEWSETLTTHGGRVWLSELLRMNERERERGGEGERERERERERGGEGEREERAGEGEEVEYKEEYACMLVPTIWHTGNEPVVDIVHRLLHVHTHRAYMYMWSYRQLLAPFLLYTLCNLAYLCEYMVGRPILPSPPPCPMTNFVRLCMGRPDSGADVKCMHPLPKLL